MGAAAAWRLASRGRRVLLLDRHVPPHRLGSSHGETRIIREAYFEHPAYVPLVRRAYELWRELEAQSGEQILRITGGLMIGPPDGAVVTGARASADQFHLPYELLDARQISARFPAITLPPGHCAVHEPRAGMLSAETCVSALLARAGHHRADLHFDEALTGWTATADGVDIVTTRGRYQGAQLVVCAGAWLPQLVPELASRFWIERQVMHWFHPTAHTEWFEPGTLPIHVWEYEPGRYAYALPDAGAGVKMALHHQGEPTIPDQVNRDVDPEERAAMVALAQRWLPLLSESPHRCEVCLYTNTADGHFLIDHHPDHPQVLVVSPCSGHGFKFAPVVGELVADLATNGGSSFDLSLFALNRRALER